jgi:hypothetical protein
MGALKFEIDHRHEQSGWITCRLSIDGAVHAIHTSAIFPPFGDLLRFVRAVAWQHLPAHFEIDEEGTQARFQAFPLADYQHLVHLLIHHTEFEEDAELSEVLWLDTALPRSTVVETFLPPVLDFASQFPRAEGAWGISRQAVEKCASECAAGLAVSQPRPGSGNGKKRRTAE